MTSIKNEIFDDLLIGNFMKLRSITWIRYMMAISNMRLQNTPITAEMYGFWRRRQDYAELRRQDYAELHQHRSRCTPLRRLISRAL